MNECWRAGVDCDANNVDDRIVDQTSVAATSASPQNRNGDIANNNINLRATLLQDANFGGTCTGTGSNGTPLCAHWCRDASATALSSNICGNALIIEGILNTYDELHLRQFGTIQEIWVQLMYAYGTYTTVNSNAGGFESPFPNLFFNAPEVHSITASCSDNYGKEQFANWKPILLTSKINFIFLHFYVEWGPFMHLIFCKGPYFCTVFAPPKKKKRDTHGLQKK